jgi:hypothetical protein
VTARSTPRAAQDSADAQSILAPSLATCDIALGSAVPAASRKDEGLRIVMEMLEKKAGAH